MLITEKIESVLGRRPTSTKDPRSILLEKHSLSAGLASQLKNDSSQHLINSVARQNLKENLSQNPYLYKIPILSLPTSPFAGNLIMMKNAMQMSGLTSIQKMKVLSLG